MIIKPGKEKQMGIMKIQEYLINPNFSATLIEIDGEHKTIKCLKEDRIYFIIEGNGKFIINNKESNVSVNDLIFISKNTPYNIIGKMKYLLIHSPAFKPGHDVSLNK
jgi:mannose-6-phosphate isomerase-like protein (cupin superfamily)